MGLLDCVGGRKNKSKEKFQESERPISRPKNPSRSLRDISQRFSSPIFSSQSTLKNVRDIDFWRGRTLQFLFSPEGEEDIGILRVPLKELGYQNVTDFITAIPRELVVEYENQATDDRIAKDFKVFWVREGIAEPGIFRWQGVLDNVTCMGLQLDRKKAVRFGIHDGKGMFYCKVGHRAMVPAKEVIPYKKFLRRYLDTPPPPKKGPSAASIRLSKKLAEVEQLSVAPSAPPKSRTNSRVTDNRFAEPTEKPSPEKYKELEMECINSLHLPSSSTKADDLKPSDKSSGQVPAKLDETLEEKGNESKMELGATTLPPNQKDDPEEPTDKSESEEKASVNQLDTKVELHAHPPPVPGSPLPDSEEETETQETVKLCNESLQHKEITETLEATIIRTLIENQKKKTDRPRPAPRTSHPPTLPPEEREKSPAHDE